MVRDTDGLRWRVPPAVVVGHSRTGEMDKVDGPYYFFTAFAAMAKVPSVVPMVLPDTGDTNVVPVDYVADALVERRRVRAQGEVYHLVNRNRRARRAVPGDLVRGRAARHPAASPAGWSTVRSAPAVGGAPASPGTPPSKNSGDLHPRPSRNLGFTATYTSELTRKALAGSGITVPDLRDYGPKLFTYWRDHLDSSRLRRRDGLEGRNVVITGASSGIGRQTAIDLGARARG
ncbi:Male sterility domain protein OS=Tsukamurella paurometabola (strain ATCC 8368 / DSM / CCUG 35730/ CIP 100753 / JCM 10117 / KCTC 9821 / NBRC 16120 / NCIMB 702349 / NCTC 13040) OX=521096 GN=Tpau_3608 PE=3 SV=1 [Tsukamurella paurometabola]